MIRDADLTVDRLADEVGELLSQPDRLAGMGAAARRLSRPDAAAVIAGQLLEIAR